MVTKTPGTQRGTLVERVAMELYQIEAEAASRHEPYPLTAEQSWARISDVLRGGYRRDARRLLELVVYHLKKRDTDE